MPLTDDALTLTVLREIRDEARTTNVRLDETNARLGHVENALLELSEQQTFVVQWLKGGTQRDRRIQEDVIKLSARVDAIEARLPISEE